MDMMDLPRNFLLGGIMRLDQYGRQEKALTTQDDQRFADGRELAREMRLIFMRGIHQDDELQTIFIFAFARSLFKVGSYAGFNGPGVAERTNSSLSTPYPRRLLNISLSVSPKNRLKIEEDDESKEDEDDLEENAEAEDEDEEEEPKISIARLAKKSTGIKALTAAAVTTPKLKRKIDKNSPDSWAGEAVSDQTSGIPSLGSLLHLLRKKQDQNELNKARARVKELEANVGNVQADLKATTNQLEKTRPTMAYLVAMIRKLRGMVEQLATQAAEIDLNPEQQDTLAALLNDNEALVEGMCKELPAFAKRAFDDSDDQFNTWVKDVKENIPVSTAPSQTSSTPTVAPVEKPKKRVIPSFGVQKNLEYPRKIEERAKENS